MRGLIASSQGPLTIPASDRIWVHFEGKDYDLATDEWAEILGRKAPVVGHSQTTLSTQNGMTVVQQADSSYSRDADAPWPDSEHGWPSQTSDILTGAIVFKINTGVGAAQELLGNGGQYDGGSSNTGWSARWNGDDGGEFQTKLNCNGPTVAPSTSGTLAAGQWHTVVFQIAVSPNNMEIWLNGAKDVDIAGPAGPDPRDPINNFRVGDNRCAIAEFVIHRSSDPLSDNEKKALHSYLKTKWGTDT